MSCARVTWQISGVIGHKSLQSPDCDSRSLSTLQAKDVRTGQREVRAGEERTWSQKLPRGGGRSSAWFQQSLGSAGRRNGACSRPGGMNRWDECGRRVPCLGKIARARNQPEKDGEVGGGDSAEVLKQRSLMSQRRFPEKKHLVRNVQCLAMDCTDG